MKRILRKIRKLGEQLRKPRIKTTFKGIVVEINGKYKYVKIYSESLREVQRTVNKELRAKGVSSKNLFAQDGVVTISFRYWKDTRPIGGLKEKDLVLVQEIYPKVGKQGDILMRATFFEYWNHKVDQEHFDEKTGLKNGRGFGARLFAKAEKIQEYLENILHRAKRKIRKIRKKF